MQRRRQRTGERRQKRKEAFGLVHKAIMRLRAYRALQYLRQMNAKRWKEKRVNLPFHLKVSEPESGDHALAIISVAFMLLFFFSVAHLGIAIDMPTGTAIGLAVIEAAVLLSFGLWLSLTLDYAGLPGQVFGMGNILLLVSTNFAWAAARQAIHGSPSMGLPVDPSSFLPTGGNSKSSRGILGSLGLLIGYVTGERGYWVPLVVQWGLFACLAIVYYFLATWNTNEYPLAQQYRERYYQVVFGANKRAHEAGGP